MNIMLDEKLVNESMASLYIYDKITRAGFPLTEDIMCLDVSELSLEERLRISANELDDVIEKHGVTLISQMVLATEVLGYVLNELFQNEPKHKQDQALASVRAAISKLNKRPRGGDDDVSE